MATLFILDQQRFLAISDNARFLARAAMSASSVVWCGIPFSSVCVPRQRSTPNPEQGFIKKVSSEVWDLDECWHLSPQNLGISGLTILFESSERLQTWRCTAEGSACESVGVAESLRTMLALVRAPAHARPFSSTPSWSCRCLCRRRPLSCTAAQSVAERIHPDSARQSAPAPCSRSASWLSSESRKPESDAFRNTEYLASIFLRLAMQEEDVRNSGRGCVRRISKACAHGWHDARVASGKPLDNQSSVPNTWRDGIGSVQEWPTTDSSSSSICFGGLPHSNLEATKMSDVRAL